MNDTIIIAVISFLGSVIGTLGGILTSAKLTNFRLEQLEKKVEAQSKNFAELPVLKERIALMNRRVATLETRHHTHSYFDTEQ